MAELTSAAMDSRRAIWGVLRTGPPSHHVPENHARTLAGALGGLVTVGSDFPAASTVAVPVQRDATPGDCLAAGLRELPSSADAVVWFDSHNGFDPAFAVAELSEHLQDFDAALFAVPVTEAIKDVRRDRIVRNVPRRGLCVPLPPMVVRAGVARSRLLGLLEVGHDPVAALSVGRLSVRTIPTRQPAAL